MALNEALKDTGDGSCVHVNGMSILTPGKTINLRMDGVDGETPLLMLDGKGSLCFLPGLRVGATRQNQVTFYLQWDYPKMKRGLPSEFRSQRKTRLMKP